MCSAPIAFRILSWVRRKASGSYIVPVLGDGNRYGLCWVLFVLGNQQVDCLLRKGQSANGISRFWWAYHQFPVNSIYLLGDGKRFALPIQVRPLKGQQFTAPQAGSNLQIEEVVPQGIRKRSSKHSLWDRFLIWSHNDYHFRGTLPYKA